MILTVPRRRAKARPGNRALRTALVFLTLSLLLLRQPILAQTHIFINEIHYDNAGTDAGEAVEIAGPAGTDLTGWRIVRYNGSTGRAYSSPAAVPAGADVLQRTIPDQCGGFGVLVVNFSRNGLQNGAPDGLALVDAGGAVVQFISYEGGFQAADGPAAGLASADIGVAETNSTAAGTSLQLTGTGSSYEAFTWQAARESTFSACNAGQTFVSAGDAAPVVGSTAPADGATGIPAGASIEIVFSEPVDTLAGWFEIRSETNGALAARASGGPTAFTLAPVMPLVAGERITVTVFAARITDADSNDPPDQMALDVTFQFTVAVSPPALVINEIHADPDPGGGDANGDGVVSTTGDEFIELYNSGDTPLDLSGWTIADAVRVRHVFPAGTVVRPACAIVIFGGGTPQGGFGGAVSQTASSGTLALNNSGDTITVSDGFATVVTATYGPEGGANQSLTRDPDITGTEFVPHSTAAAAGGALFSPGTKSNGAPFDGCILTAQELEIWEIQGAGLASPYAGEIVTTAENIVTAVAPDGFFLQTPPLRSDGDPETSDGIFVFVGAAPQVLPGDVVTATGTVQERQQFTTLAGEVQITAIGSTSPLPAPVLFDTGTPPPDQPVPANALERFEGMRVTLQTATVTGPSNAQGIARIVAGLQRAVREPGIRYPGHPTLELPVWDGNPEVLALDPDRLGLADIALAAGTRFAAEGVLAEAAGDYQIWPAMLQVQETPVLPRAARLPEPGELRIATLNMERFFDDLANGPGPQPDPETYQCRLGKFSQLIRELMLAPDILALQEVENLHTLQDLAARIEAEAPGTQYAAFLREGNDSGGIDVGFLVRQPLTVLAVEQLGADEVFAFDGSLLHDRPPLLLHAALSDGTEIRVLNLHLRSLIGIEGSSAGRVKAKRDAQAKSIAAKIQQLQVEHPDDWLIIAGDLNTFPFTDGYVDVLGQIMGTPAAAGQAELPGTDLIDPDLFDPASTLPAAERYSFIHDGDAQQLDYLLVSQTARSLVRDLQFVRGNTDAPALFSHDPDTVLRASDHDGLVLYLSLQQALQDTYVLLAQEDVEFAGETVSAGLVHANDDIEFEPGSGSRHTGDLHAVDDIEITRGNRIDGDILAGDDLKNAGDIAGDVHVGDRLKNTGTIRGEQVFDAAVDSVALPAVAEFPVAAGDLEIEKENAATFAPGIFGEVEVEDRATLVLAHDGTAGAFTFAGLELEDGAILRIDVTAGPVNINVAGIFELDRDSAIEVRPAGHTAAVTISVRGSHKVKIGRAAVLRGTLVAPQAKVEIRENARVHGAVIAKKIKMRRGAMVLHHTVAADFHAFLPKSRTSGIERPQAPAMPREFHLYANYPNPFNAGTTIRFALPEPGRVTLDIYDLAGQLIRHLVNARYPAGVHEIVWDATDDASRRVASSVYLCRLVAGGFAAQRKLLLIK